MKRKFCLFSLAIACLHAETGYKVTGRYPIGGTEGWDYVSIDSAARRLYVSHGVAAEVIDADTGKLLGTIPDTPGIHGIAVAPAFNHGFTSNGREDKVTMFDLRTLKRIEKIDVGKGPDGIFYEPGTKRIFTNNHGSHDITAIDAETGKVVGTVPVEGDGEEMIKGKNGMMFVNLEDKAEVAEFDPTTLAVKNRFPIGAGETPTGLAYDAKHNRLFIGCRSKVMVVMDASNGKVVANFPIGTGVDWAEFDAESRMVFISNGDGTLNIFHQKTADEYEDAGTVTTQASAKTMAFDAKTKKIFLPCAEVETIPATDPNKRPTRKIKEGTFGLLIVSK